MQVQSVVFHLVKEIILQKVQTFKCFTIDESGQKEVVMALLLKKKQFKTVTQLYGLLFTTQIVDSFKKVLNLLCNFSCGIQYSLMPSNYRVAETVPLLETLGKTVISFSFKCEAIEAKQWTRSNTCFLQTQESESR